MIPFSRFFPGQFVIVFLNRLCKRDIKSFDPHHDPGLRGLYAIREHLEQKIMTKVNEDLILRVSADPFMPSPFSGFVGLEWHMVEIPLVRSHFIWFKGTTYYFEGCGYEGFLSNASVEMIDLADELAEVFAKAYRGG